MIMNVLNGIWSDIYILQTIIQKEKKKKEFYLHWRFWLWKQREISSLRIKKMLIMINTRILYQFYILIKNLNAFIFEHLYMFHITSWNKTFLSLMFTNIQYRKNIKKSLLDCFKINGKQKIQMLKNLNALNSKTLKEK